MAISKACAHRDIYSTYFYLRSVLRWKVARLS